MVQLNKRQSLKIDQTIERRWVGNDVDDAFLAGKIT